MEKCSSFFVIFSKFGVKFEHTDPDQATQMRFHVATLIAGVTETILSLHKDCSSLEFSSTNVDFPDTSGITFYFILNLNLHSINRTNTYDITEPQLHSW